MLYCLFAALKALGFSSYVEECRGVLTECKHVAMKRRRGSSRLENLGIPEEELLRQQQELFAQVRSLDNWDALVFTPRQNEGYCYHFLFQNLDAN